MTLEEIYGNAKALVEDKTYQIGEISEKTGLQKTANGWVKPKGSKNSKVDKRETKENEPKENNGEKKTKPSSKKSLKLPDEKSSFQTDVNRMKKLKKEDYKQYTIQLEKLHSKYPINKWKDLYNKTVNDSTCRITADTKIKLKNVVEDRTYQIGEISEKTGLQKTSNGWVKPKKGTTTKEEENKNTFVKFDKNPVSADVGDWAFSSYEDGSTEEELAGFIYESIEMDANVDIGEVLHNLDLHVENFDKDNQKKWEKVKNDFIKRFKPKQTHNPMSTKNKKEEQKEQKPKKDYGKATGAAKKVIDMIDDLEVPYKDFFLECLQKGLSVDDALDELRSKKVAYYAGSKFDPKREKVNQFYDLQDTLKNKGLRTVVPLNWGFWE